MKRPAWFARECPRDWGSGKVRVEGDDLLFKFAAAKYIIKVLGIVMSFWVVVVLIFCISDK